MAKSKLEMDAHGNICNCLKYLDKDDFIELGEALGLLYTNIKDRNSRDIVAAWLRKEDNVKSTSGEPTWSTLADALEKIGQTGIAVDARKQIASPGSLSTDLHEEAIQPTYGAARKRTGGILVEAYGDTKKVKLASPGDELSGEKEQFMGKRKRMITNETEPYYGESKRQKLADEKELMEESGSQSFQYRESAENQEYHAIVDVNSMKHKFACLQDQIWSVIDDRRELSSYLVEMNMLSNDDENQVKDTCIYLAQRNWSFLDYENLEHIVEKKCSTVEQQKMKEYDKEMQRFCERKVSEFPPCSFGSDISHTGMKKLYVTLDLSKSDPSLKQIKDLKHSIAEIFGFSTSKLVLYEIENGSVVTFLVTSSAGVEPLECSLNAQEEDVLKREHVVSLKYESKFIFAVKRTKFNIQEPEYLRKQLDNKKDTDDIVTFQSLPISFPYLDLNEEQLQQRLYSDSVDIMYKFQKLFEETTKSLEQRGISAKLLSRHLKCLGSLKPTFADIGLPQLRLQLPQVQESDTENAMSIIADYCSFFNYGIIEHIINKLGTKDDKDNLSEYKESFAEYAKRHIFECPSNVGTETVGDVKIYVILDENYDKSTVSSLHLFVSNIEKILRLPPGSGLKLCRIEPGSLKLTFQLPFPVLQDTFPLSTEQEIALGNLGVNNLWLIYQFNRQQQELQNSNTPSENSEDVAADLPISPQDSNASCESSDSEHIMIAAGEEKANSIFSDSAIGTSIITAEGDTKEGVFIDSSRASLRYSDKFQLHHASRRGKVNEVKRLVEKEHLDPLQKDKTGNTALHYAAAGGHLQILQYFIEEVDCAPASLGRQECTPLHTAAQYGRLGVVKYLIEKQMQEPQFKDEEGLTALHRACQGGNLEVVRYLVDRTEEHTQLKDKLDDKTKKGNNSLHYASLHEHLDIVKYLISVLQCNPNAQGSQGRTALHCATEKGNLDIVKYLVEEGKCNPSHCTGGDKMTPLHIAAKFGQLKIVQYLSQEQYCPLMCKNCDGDTPLNIAALSGQFKIVEFFISVMKCNPNTPGEKNKTPMHNAAQGGYLDIIKYLAEVQKCDPSQCLGIDDVTPLHDAARAGQLKVVKYLTQEKNCNPLSKKSDGETPLNDATYGGHLDIVDFFISELKCDPNTPGEEGRIPLHLAVQQGHMHIVKYLVEKQKCDPSYCKGEDKVTPLHVASFFGRLDMVKYLTQDKRCDPLSKNAKGETALNDAALKGSYDVVRYFISEMNCDPNTKGEIGRVPLHLSAQGGHMDLVKYLTEERKCNPSPFDDDNMTPLHLAAMFGHLDVVKHLVYDRHCNPSVEDSYPLTPLHYAAREGHIDVIKYFITTCKCPPNIKGYRDYTPLKLAEIRRHTHVVNYLKAITTN